VTPALNDNITWHLFGKARKHIRDDYLAIRDTKVLLFLWYVWMMDLVVLAGGERSCLFRVMARLRNGDSGAGVQFLAGGRDFHFFKAFGLAMGPIKFRI
jgi:hypothetical protein